jgi:DNA repair protein SbcC/Rad50
MIPVKLSLKNFMCYRDNVPPLSFEGIHIACLCGDNGNGKSALFDAITWALWGKSRARSDDDLIHTGQSEMEIALEFMSGKQRYRVLRKHSKKPSKARAGQTVLELQIASDGAFRSISGNLKSETQQKINEILNLDYETFENSAFLRQGHADEFSIKPAGKRKEILANILGLSHFDELESRAKEQSGKRRAEADRLEIAITDIELQLANKATCEDEIKKIQSEITKLEDIKKSEQTAISSLRSLKAALEIKKEQLSNTQVHLNETKKELERREAKTKEFQARITEYELVLAERAAIEKGYSEFKDAKTLNEDFNRKLGQLFALREQISKLDQVIKKAAQALTIEHRIVQAKFAENEAKFTRTTRLEESLTQARKHMLELSKQEEIVSKKRKQAQQTASRISYLESTDGQLAKEIAGLNEKLKLLRGDDARCPLCETELGPDGRRQIEAKLNSEAQQKVKARQSINEELSKNQSKLQALENELIERESALNKERAIRHSQLSIIEKELTEAREAGNELSQEKTRLEELEQLMAKKDYAVYEQQTLTQLENEEHQLGYKKERHDEIRRQLADLQKYESLKLELDEAIKNIDKEKSELTETKQTISNLNATIIADLNKQENLRGELLSLPDIIDKLAKEEESHQASLQKERQVHDSLVTLQERLRQLAELEISKQEKTRLIQESLNEEGIYKELAEAFSKKGIQALLIEQALPEIEMEANRLLAKMTDNRMAVRLESQRETRKGDTIETLDINIADELGTRNYEMYSGGEAFRIDLALRIALSMLLVRRAGASLPILIIDEGFGTQDSASREKLIEAINSIQDDFEKIIVITHLEEMKDKFETLINVTKTANGSMISIS